MHWHNAIKTIGKVKNKRLVWFQEKKEKEVHSQHKSNRVRGGEETESGKKKKNTLKGTPHQIKS